MRSNSHPWGIPPWTIDFRPKVGELPARVDFAVVGGGFSGLSAAAWLRRLAPEKSVLVLESGTLGNGASGRTGGMALAESAAGPLPGLGDVLAGYKKILRALCVDCRLELPGAYELGRSKARKNSAISWSDSGNLRIVRRVPGGTVDPGKVVSGLGRAAEQAGAQIAEHAEVQSIEFSKPLRLHVMQRFGGREHKKEMVADHVLLATNALELELTALRSYAEAKLTFALATVPLTLAQRKALGLAGRHPFYSVDMPYLWGRLLEDNGAIFGAGLVPPLAGGATPSSVPLERNSRHELWRYDVRKGEAAACLDWLETRVRHLHPALADVRITHRWGGPILFTEKMLPVFRRHTRSDDVMILAGFNGHGVALSVYLGHWAAQSLVGRRALPRWEHS
jgi:glycine/D-amino acid oxidase-like deaminating enzyme